MRITKLLKGKEIGKSIVAAGCTCNTCTCTCSCCWGGDGGGDGGDGGTVSRSIE